MYITQVHNRARLIAYFYINPLPTRSTILTIIPYTNPSEAPLSQTTCIQQQSRSSTNLTLLVQEY